MQLLFYLTYPSYFLDEFVTSDVIGRSFNLFFLYCVFTSKFNSDEAMEQAILYKSTSNIYFDKSSFFPVNTSSCYVKPGKNV